MAATALADSPNVAASTPSPSLARLIVRDFRNYGTARLDLDARPVVLTGPNGAGKTNLLEAISLLNPGRGLRRARLEEVGRLGADGPWSIAARLTIDGDALDLGTGRDPEGGDAARRVVRRNGATATPAALADDLALVWLTPAMDRLFMEAAGERRRFLDRLVFGADPGHAQRVASYDKAMRERSKLLREGRADPAWLDALEATMAEYGIAVAAARRELIARLTAAVDLADGPFPTPDLTLDGLIEFWLETEPALAVEDRFRDRLAANRPRDGEAGAATEGPHRTDFSARHRQRAMPAALCSTGEQKALLIAIVLANARLVTARRGRPPILLLDEIVAHLDRVRRQALVQAIAGLGAQMWATGTDPILFEEWADRAQFFTVLGGEVIAAPRPRSSLQ